VNPRVEQEVIGYHRVSPHVSGKDLRRLVL